MLGRVQTFESFWTRVQRTFEDGSFDPVPDVEGICVRCSMFIKFPRADVVPDDDGMSQIWLILDFSRGENLCGAL